MRIFFTHVEKTSELHPSIHGARNPWESAIHIGGPAIKIGPNCALDMRAGKAGFLMWKPEFQPWTAGKSNPCPTTERLFLCVENDASINLYPYHRWVELSGRLGNVWVKGLVWFPQKFLVHTSQRKKSRMHKVLNEVYLQNLFRNEYNFSRRI